MYNILNLFKRKPKDFWVWDLNEDGEEFIDEGKLIQAKSHKEAAQRMNLYELELSLS